MAISLSQFKEAIHPSLDEWLGNNWRGIWSSAVRKTILDEVRRRNSLVLPAYVLLDIAVDKGIDPEEAVEVMEKEYLIEW